MAEKIIVTKDVKVVDQEVKTFSTHIIDTYDDCVVIKVQGWRMGVYLELSKEDLEYYLKNKQVFNGRLINVSYVGDLEDVFALKYLPIKSIK